MSVLEFSSLWSVISSGLLNLTVRAQYASFFDRSCHGCRPFSSRGSIIKTLIRGPRKKFIGH